MIKISLRGSFENVLKRHFFYICLHLGLKSVSLNGTSLRYLFTLGVREYVKTVQETRRQSKRPEDMGV